MFDSRYYTKHYYSDKSKDYLTVYDLNEEKRYDIIYNSDRLNVFNQHICDVTGIGYLLSMQNRWWMTHTNDIIENHFMYNCGNATLVRKSIPIKLKFIVSGYLTGELWNAYEKGKRIINGYKFDDYLSKNQKLTKLVITSTRKDNNDTPITFEEIINLKILEIDELELIITTVNELYNYGHKISDEKGIILADTKYEFGYSKNGIMLIDELHTSDTSRFWLRDTYNVLTAQELEQVSYDKDIARHMIDNKTYDILSINILYIEKELVLKYHSLYKILTNIGLEQRECFKPHFDITITSMCTEFEQKNYYGCPDVKHCLLYLEMLETILPDR